MGSAVIARPLWNSCYLLARFSVYDSMLASYLAWRKLIIYMNLNFCIQIKLFPNFHNKIVHLIFTFFVRLLQNLVQSWQPLLSQPTFLTYPTYLTYLTSLKISLKHRAQYLFTGEGGGEEANQWEGKRSVSSQEGSKIPIWLTVSPIYKLS